jgi:hypothetical protein
VSTVAEIEAALPTLSAEELTRVAAALNRLQGDHVVEPRTWMELAGCLARDKEELQRIDRLIEAEFEQINPNDWL